MVKLPSGHWRDRPVINGKRMSFTAPTQREVREQIDNYKLSLTQKEADQNDPLVKDIIEDYITSKTGVLSPSTIKGYRRMQKNNYGKISSLRLSEVTSKELQYFVSDISADLSAKSVKNVYGLLSASLNQVSDRKYKVTLPTVIRPMLPTPTDDTVQRLLNAVRQNDLRIAMMIAAFGTMRRGEISAIKFGDIDLKRHAIFVHADMVQDEDNNWIYKAYPKTELSIRLIQYPEEVFDYIPEGNKDDFVVPRNPQALSHAFRRLRDRIGAEGITLQSLRRYAASFMHALGIPDKYIMETGGWASDRVLKAVYENTLSDKQVEFAEKRTKYVASKFFNKISGHELDTPRNESSDNE